LNPFVKNDKTSEYGFPLLEGGQGGFKSNGATILTRVRIRFLPDGKRCPQRGQRRLDTILKFRKASRTGNNIFDPFSNPGKKHPGQVGQGGFLPFTKLFQKKYNAVDYVLQSKAGVTIIHT
jgi:hypothetical protein